MGHKEHKDNKIPKELLNSKFRRAMWQNAQKTLRKLEKIMPISSVYLLGSFTTAQQRPQDIDVIILVKSDSKKKDEQWSFDLQIVPDNKYGEWMLEECRKWMKRKYGAKKSAVIRLK